MAVGKAPMGSELWIEGRVGHYVTSGDEGKGYPVGLSPLSPKSLLKRSK